MSQTIEKIVDRLLINDDSDLSILFIPSGLEFDRQFVNNTKHNIYCHPNMPIIGTKVYDSKEYTNIDCVVNAGHYRNVEQIINIKRETRATIINVFLKKLDFKKFYKIKLSQSFSDEINFCANQEIARDLYLGKSAKILNDFDKQILEVLQC